MYVKLAGEKHTGFSKAREGAHLVELLRALIRRETLDRLPERVAVLRKTRGPRDPVVVLQRTSMVRTQAHENSVRQQFEVAT